MTNTVSGWRRVVVLLLLPLFLAMPPGCSSTSSTSGGKANLDVLSLGKVAAVVVLAPFCIALDVFGAAFGARVSVTVEMLRYFFYYPKKAPKEARVIKHEKQQRRKEATRRINEEQRRKKGRAFYELLAYEKAELLAYEKALAAELVARMELHPQ